VLSGQGVHVDLPGKVLYVDTEQSVQLGTTPNRPGGQLGSASQKSLLVVMDVDVRLPANRKKLPSGRMATEWKPRGGGALEASATPRVPKER
jgi:hypothetical protein